MPVIKLDNISFSYLSTPLLESVSLHIGDGERACLVGPNGCGKTTLLRIASGDLPPDSGVVSVEGVSRVPIIDKFSGTVGDYLDAALIRYELSLFSSMRFLLEWGQEHILASWGATTTAYLLR
ncbi:ATP-binding cassette domain-containing protein [Trueperella pyogenes]|uniref:ATP-binding cassette domain-containing protein n=1 Tax=Trueperella pyogenes TaxID=1661 RepID=UPI00345D69B6